MWLNGKEHDRTEAHKTLRQFKEDRPAEFMKVKKEMEAAHKAKMAPAAVEAVLESDAGTARCVELATRLLKELSEAANEQGEKESAPGAQLKLHPKK